MPILETILGAVAPTLIGGLFGKNSQSKADAKNAAMSEKMYNLNRRDFYEDRENDRAYVRRRTQAAQNRDDKLYRRDLKQAQADKANERKYVAKNHAADQRQLDAFSLEAVETRGVDFQKMRDQAIAAGFNPLSVLGTAGMYSTERNRQLAGREGIGGAYGGGGGSGGTPVTGGFSTVGASGGYNREYTPALASGGFIAEAVARGVDTLFNSPQGMDMQGIGAQMIKDKAAQDTLAKQVAAQDYRQRFGYDLTSVTSYRPAISVGGPAMSGGAPPVPKAGNTLAQPAASDDATAPAKLPIRIGGKDLPTQSNWSDTEVIETRYGELMAELYGGAYALSDAWNAAKTHPRWKKFGGKSYNSPANNFKGDGISYNGLPAQSNPRKPKLRSPSSYAPGGGKTYKIPDWQTFNY